MPKSRTPGKCSEFTPEKWMVGPDVFTSLSGGLFSCATVRFREREF